MTDKAKVDTKAEQPKDRSRREALAKFGKYAAAAPATMVVLGSQPRQASAKSSTKVPPPY